MGFINSTLASFTITLAASTIPLLRAFYVSHGRSMAALASSSLFSSACFNSILAHCCLLAAFAFVQHSPTQSDYGSARFYSILAHCCLLAFLESSTRSLYGNVRFCVAFSHAVTFWKRSPRIFWRLERGVKLPHALAPYESYSTINTLTK